MLGDGAFEVHGATYRDGASRGGTDPGRRRVLEVDWRGRHSDDPPSDTIDILLAGLVGDVSETTWTPGDDDGSLGDCASRDTVGFERAATFSTRDGQVTGTGVVTFWLSALELESAQIWGSGEVTLSDERWSEVESVVTDAQDDLPSMGFGRMPGYDYAEIAYSGVSVWICNEQVHEACATWR